MVCRLLVSSITNQIFGTQNMNAPIIITWRLRVINTVRIFLVEHISQRFASAANHINGKTSTHHLCAPHARLVAKIHHHIRFDLCILSPRRLIPFPFSARLFFYAPRMMMMMICRFPRTANACRDVILMECDANDAPRMLRRVSAQHGLQLRQPSSLLGICRVHSGA